MISQTEKSGRIKGGIEIARFEIIKAENEDKYL